MPSLSLSSFIQQRPEDYPVIYAYSDTRYRGLLKVGYTTRSVEERINEQYPIKLPEQSHKIEYVGGAIRSNGDSFSDHDVHNLLKKNHFQNVGGEWYECKVNDVKAAVLALQEGIENKENRSQNFKMRPEQSRAVDKTIAYFESAKKEIKVPKFLWNCKMRFGKTFAAYQLAKKKGFKKILVLTFKPAVESAWEEDLNSHLDFEGWQFISNKSAQEKSMTLDEAYQNADMNKPIVCFGSFQDFMQKNENGGIKAKNEWVHATNWDLVIFDEYHFGAWRENAKKLFDKVDEEKDDVVDFDMESYQKEEAGNACDESFLPITTSYYLYLSGTPFRALNSGEFIEEQIFNWTYSDEQQAKQEWDKKHPGTTNPYAALPRMVMLTYKLPDGIRQIVEQGEFNEFDLNVFFTAEGKGADAQFKYKNEVQKWLDLIRGAYLPSSVEELKLGADKKPPMPFADTTLLRELLHTLWFLPNIASCCAMKNLLEEPQNKFYRDYKINLCAGSGAGIGLDALKPVQNSMRDPLYSKSITLTCGKLTTGVTVKPWSGIFMLRNLKSPETYFQAAFRVQSPWEIDTDEFIGTVRKKKIVKHECYVFDFALDRALKQIAGYSCRLSVQESDPEKKVQEFIQFLPVLAYDGSTMKQIDAAEVLDIAMSGTSATLLAKRWESALLVNVDNETLARLMASEEAMEALMRIEGFRSLNDDITNIINKTDKIKKAKGDDKKKTKKEKESISEDEKEIKSKRKMIQEKLIKFATRIPVFMYLTDYRERCLKDVITQLEPGLFQKVTGLSVKDFELLVSLNVFNGPLMNDAIFKFKRYEDASLSYTGIDRHENAPIGGFDTVISRNEFQCM